MRGSSQLVPGPSFLVGSSRPLSVLRVSRQRWSGGGASGLICIRRGSDNGRRVGFEMRSCQPTARGCGRDRGPGGGPGPAQRPRCLGALAAVSVGRLKKLFLRASRVGVRESRRDGAPRLRGLCGSKSARPKVRGGAVRVWGLRTWRIAGSPRGEGAGRLGTLLVPLPPSHTLGGRRRECGVPAGICGPGP